MASACSQKHLSPDLNSDPSQTPPDVPIRRSHRAGSFSREPSTENHWGETRLFSLPGSQLSCLMGLMKPTRTSTAARHRPSISILDMLRTPAPSTSDKIGGVDRHTSSQTPNP